MLGLLIKKQFTELFRGFFYDQRKGRLRSKGASIGFIVLYAVLIVGIVGGMFTVMANALCPPLAEAGLGWLFFLIMALLGLVLGVFGSVFSTYSSLYLARDNDQLLSLPIPVRQILVSRILMVYVMGLLFSGAATVPAVIVYAATCGMTAASLIGGLIYVLLISLAVLLLSCVLGWVVARLSLKFKNKSFLTVILSLAIIGIYYYFYFRAQEMLQSLLANASALGAKLGGGWSPLYMLGRGAEGDLLRMLPVVAIVLVLTALVWYVLERSFLKIATASAATGKTRYKGGAMKARSASRALLARELGHFIANPNYMLNCGLGILAFVAGAVALLWKGAVVRDALESTFRSAPGAMAVLAAAAVCLVNSMDIVTAPSVSLEGRSIWIVQSLPVASRQVLLAKLRAQLAVTLPPLALFCVCASIALRLTLPEGALMLVLGALSDVFIGAVGLWLNLLKPNLSWSNEIVPIKQSLNVLLTLLLGFLHALAVGGLFLLFAGSAGVPSTVYLALASAVTAVIDVLLLLWLRGRGAAIFEEL